MHVICQKYYPAKALEKYVNCFYFFDDQGLFPGVSVQILNDGVTELIIHIGDTTTFKNLDEKVKNQHRMSLNGQYLDRVLTTPTGHTRILTANFKPGGMYGIFGIPQSVFESNSINLYDIDPIGSGLLWEKLMESTDIETRILELESYLIGILNKKKTPVIEMANITQTICLCGGLVSINKLATDMKLSIRTFNRRFLTQVGIAPKQFANVIRINRLCEDIMKEENPDWLTFALKHRFYDQAHMIHMFKRYLSCTPAEFLKYRLKGADYTGKITMIPKDSLDY